MFSGARRTRPRRRVPGQAKSLRPNASGPSLYPGSKLARGATRTNRCPLPPGKTCSFAFLVFAKSFPAAFSNSFYFSFSAPRSSLGLGLRALLAPLEPHLLHLVQARHHLVAASSLPPLGGALQVWGARPLNLLITARGRILSPLQRPKIPAPATSAPKKKLPGGRNLWFLPSRKKRRRRRRRVHVLHPPRPCRKLPCRQPPPPRQTLQFLSNLTPRQRRRRKLLFLRRRPHLRRARDLPRLRRCCRRQPPRPPNSLSRGRPAERPWTAALQAARSL